MLTQIMKRVKLGTWFKTDIDNFNSCYLIAIKDVKGKTDTIDPKDLKKIIFDLGIDSGITDVPLPIGRVTLNFEDVLTPESELNGKAASFRLTNIPSEFYIKAVSIIINDNGVSKQVTEGEVALNVNINSLNI